MYVGTPRGAGFSGFTLVLNVFLLRNPGGRLGSSRGSTQVDLYGMVLGLGLAP